MDQDRSQFCRADDFFIVESKSKVVIVAAGLGIAD